MHLPYVLLEFLLGGLGGEERFGLWAGHGSFRSTMGCLVYYECGNLFTYVW